MRPRGPTRPTFATIAAPAVGVILVLASCSSGAGSSSPVTNPPGSTPSTSASASGASAGWSWTRANNPAFSAIDAAPATTLAAVLAPSPPGSDWVAAGARSAGAGTSTAMAWTSPDAQSWTAEPLTGSGVFSQASSATAWKGGTVVVGSVGQGTSKHAAVWISPTAGAPLASVPVSGTPSGGTANSSSPPAPASEMDLVTAGNLGYFAVGSLGGQPAIWYSTNGLQWSISAQATKFFDGLDNTRINTLLATSGLVYAAGSIGDGTATDAALWSTQDGLNWRAAEPPVGAFSGQGDHVITGLAQLGTGQAGTVGLVAVGGVDAGGDWAPVSWISPDGLTWSQPYAAFPQTGVSGGLVRAVTAVPTLAGTSILFAVGGNDTSQQVWQSSDGMRWTQIQLPTAAASSGGWHATIVASSVALTAVADGDPGQAHLLVHSSSAWSEPTANPSSIGPVGNLQQATGLQTVAGKLVLTVRVSAFPQAIGPPAVTTVSFSSPDGVAWTGTAPARSVLAAAQGPPGAAALGVLGSTWIAAGHAPGSTTVGAPGPAVVWTSPDGSHWTSAGTLDPQPGLSTESPAAVCNSSSAAVVVGMSAQPRSGTSAAAWYSQDGTHWKQASISPVVPSGAIEWMDGCFATDTGFAAFGATVSSGTLAPALWTSPDGTRWTLQSTDSFGHGAPAPLTAVAASGTHWMALAGSGETSVDAGQPAPGSLDPVGTYAAAVMYPPSAAGVGVWMSSDEGTNWQRVDGGDPVWASAAGASLEQAAYAGSTAVVAGTLDGRLAVWSGTPTL